MAVVSLNEKKMEKLAEDGNKKAAKLLKMLQNPDRFLSTIQISITLAVISVRCVIISAAVVLLNSKMFSIISFSSA